MIQICSVFGKICTKLPKNKKLNKTHGAPPTLLKAHLTSNNWMQNLQSKLCCNGDTHRVMFCTTSCTVFWATHLLSEREHFASMADNKLGYNRMITQDMHKYLAPFSNTLATQKPYAYPPLNTDLLEYFPKIMVFFIITLQSAIPLRV